MSGMETLDEIMKELENKNAQKNKSKQQVNQQYIQPVFNPQQQYQPLPYQQFPPQPYMAQPYPPQQYPQYQAPYMPQYPVQQTFSPFQGGQVQQQPQQPQQRHFISPEQSAEIDITSVILDKDKLYQLYVGNVPQNATQQQLKSVFESCGEISDTHIQPQQGKTGFGFVNFKTREGAVAAFQKRIFFMGGEKLDLAGFHKQLTIILRRIPPNVNEEQFQKIILEFYTSKNCSDIYSYVQFANARFGSSVYLHFLSIDESVRAFDLLTPIDFTKFATDKMHMLDDMSCAVYVTNEEVDRRQKAGQKPNQNLQREILQYLCVRFVPKNDVKYQSGGNPQHMQQQQMPMYQPQLIQQQPQYQQQNQYNMQNQQQQYNNNRQDSQQVIQDNSIYITGLPFGITQDAINATLSQFGKVNQVTLINSRESMGQNPSAIIYYISSSSAQQALQTGSVNLGGQDIRINPHKKRIR
ncbi:RNA recognition motif-containing protein [Spironucleus salmonicida]|uniref:RNA recognition motif-containing protein n=1 Tax=Spironucleus salmonicida TaxID=348837 RepID=V6LDP0_9EUKA|nr:RNA recognition motif-containing protein [Spironucleus salmonicida]|eukprot:EST42630.1 RNA recognition motif-containing protein [Spironucleus salmonicida]